MKILTCILLLTIVFPLLGQTPNDSVKVKQEQPTFKNQLDLDVEFLGASFGYKHRLRNNWFVGGNIGGGAIYSKLFNGNFSSPNIDTFHFQLLLQYSIENSLIIESGPRFVTFYDGDIVDKMVQAIIGVYMGFKKVQFGIRIGVLGRNIKKPEIYNLHSTSLLIVRIPLEMW